MTVSEKVFNAPTRWADAGLARLMQKTITANTYNLYNDLSRAVVNGRISGTPADLRKIAGGEVMLRGVGPQKCEALRAWVDQFLKCEVSMSWDYRMVRSFDGLRDVIGIHEVFYNDAGEPYTATEEPCSPQGDTVDELQAELAMYREALEKPMLEYDDLA